MCDVTHSSVPAITRNTRNPICLPLATPMQYKLGLLMAASHEVYALLTYPHRMMHVRPSSRLSAGRLPRTSTSSPSSVDNLIDQEERNRQHRAGQAKRRFEKEVRRNDRISVLESTHQLSDAEQKELLALCKVRDSFEEQYDSDAFTEEHTEFKRQHNQAFLGLTRYCQQQRQLEMEKVSVFFLDGADGGTTRHLIEEGGLDASQCYVANRHLSTCKSLRLSGGGLLPNDNVVHLTAAEALSPESDATDDENQTTFAGIDFTSYYFDGCGGFVPHIIGMMTSALIRNENINDNACTAVGFSLMGGNRNVIEKEMKVCQALALIAKTRGMRTRHALDDPERYGIPYDISKTYDGTFTSWILLEPDN